MSDRAAVVLALCALGGAWASRPVPWFVVVLVFFVVALRPRPALVCVAAVVLGSVLGTRAWDGVRSAPTQGVVSGVAATLVRDPEWRFGSLRTELRLADGRRVSATASEDPAGVLAPMLAGDRVVVGGRLRPVSEASQAFLARRHIGSALVVTSARAKDAGGPVTRFTNQLRRTLVEGASSLPPDRRALFTGLVLGDDREQATTEVDDFRAAGLTHLLAVSGQNVAFVLAVASPMLRRLSLRGRLVVGAAVLVGFGVLTRWEPSVVRAVGMAGLTLGAATAGRPASSLRILALATTALVLVDPLLAGSVGFLLSVSACAGIALLSPRLEARGVPSPLAVTLAAQAGVAPVLLPVFGGVPLASLPANLLAVPAAGPVMVWGLVAGLPAGIVGGTVAVVLHLPTRLLLAWISGVARVAASLPLPMLGPRAVVVVGSALGLVLAATWSVRRHGRVTTIAGGCLAAVASVVAGAIAMASPPPALEDEPFARGARLWRDDHGSVVVVLAGNAVEADLLAGLRTHGVRSIDVLVLRSGGNNSARLAAAVRHRSSVRLVIAPAGHHVVRAHEVTAIGEVVRIGTLELRIAAEGRRLDVRVASARAPRARSPPVRRDDARPRDGHPQPDDGLLLRPGRLLRPRRPRPPGRPACNRRR